MLHALVYQEILQPLSCFTLPPHALLLHALVYKDIVQPLVCFTILQHALLLHVFTLYILLLDKIELCGPLNAYII